MTDLTDDLDLADEDDLGRITADVGRAIATGRVDIGVTDLARLLVAASHRPVTVDANGHDLTGDLSHHLWRTLFAVDRPLATAALTEARAEGDPLTCLLVQTHTEEN